MDHYIISCLASHLKETQKNGTTSDFNLPFKNYSFENFKNDKELKSYSLTLLLSRWHLSKLVHFGMCLSFSALEECIGLQFSKAAKIIWEFNFYLKLFASFCRRGSP